MVHGKKITETEMKSTGHHNGSNGKSHHGANGKSHSHDLARTVKKASRKADRLVGEQYAALNKGVKKQPVMSIALAFAAGIFTTLLLGAGVKKLD